MSKVLTKHEECDISKQMEPVLPRLYSVLSATAKEDSVRLCHDHLNESFSHSVENYVHPETLNKLCKLKTDIMVATIGVGLLKQMIKKSHD